MRGLAGAYGVFNRRATSNDRMRWSETLAYDVLGMGMIGALLWAAYLYSFSLPSPPHKGEGTGKTVGH